MKTLLFQFSLVASVLAYNLNASASDILQQIAEKRDRVEQKSKAADQEWELFQSELEVYQQRKNELLLQVQKEELKTQQLELQIEKLSGVIKNSVRSNSVELKSFATWINQLRGMIDGGIDFRKEARLEKLLSIEKLLEKKTTEPSYVAEVLWDFMAREIRLGQSTEIANEEIVIDGQKKLSRVIRLGLVQMIYKTEGGDLGYGSRLNGQFLWVKAQTNEASLLNEAFQKFESGYTLGWFDLPRRALLFPENNQLGLLQIQKPLEVLLHLLFGERVLANEPASWTQAVEREVKLLSEQEAALSRRQEGLSKEKSELTRKAKASVKIQEGLLLDLQTKNEALLQTSKELGLEKTRVLSREETLQKLWTRMMKTLAHSEAKYLLRAQDEILVPPAPEGISIADLQEAWQRSVDILKNLHSLQILEVEVNSEQGVQRIAALRWGGLGVFARDQGKESQVLGPGKERELLKLGEASLGGHNSALFLFDGLGGSLTIKKHQTVLDRIADQIPLLILGLMLLVVLFIFTKLARV